MIKELMTKIIKAMIENEWHSFFQQMVNYNQGKIDNSTYDFSSYVSTTESVTKSLAKVVLVQLTGYFQLIAFFIVMVAFLLLMFVYLLSDNHKSKTFGSIMTTAGIMFLIIAGAANIFTTYAKIDVESLIEKQVETYVTTDYNKDVKTIYKNGYDINIEYISGDLQIGGYNGPHFVYEKNGQTQEIDYTASVIDYVDKNGNKLDNLDISESDIKQLLFDGKAIKSATLTHSSDTYTIEDSKTKKDFDYTEKLGTILTVTVELPDDLVAKYKETGATADELKQFAESNDYSSK